MQTPEQLRTKIVRELIPTSTSSVVLYYTMCKKQAITLSVLHHQRLLILNQVNDTIYYTNEIVSTPFKNESKVPKPKNYCPKIDRCVIKRYQEDGKPTNILSIQFNEKQDGKQKYVNWKFSMQNEDLPRQWENLIKQTKEKRIREEQKRKQQEKRQKQKEKERKRLKEQQQRKREQQQRERKRQEQSYRRNQLQLEKQRQMQLERDQQKQVEKTKRQEQQKTDWNLKFARNRSKQTIIDFSQYCFRQFHSLKIDKIKERFKEQNTVIVKFTGIIMYFTHPFSEVSRLLTEQFLNYQYILKSCGSNSCIGVPLACLIQQKGVLCMAKARFPENVKLIFKNQLKQNNPFATTIIGLFKQLQSQTKISLQVITHSCKILNLSILYDFNNGFPRIFIDELEHLLPHYPGSRNHPSLTQNSLKQLVHPQLIIKNFNRILVPPIHGIPKTEDKTQEELYFYVEQSLNQLAQLLIQQEIMICSYTDLEQIMNFYGLNISLIHSLHYLIELKTKKQQVRFLKSLLTSVKCAIIVFEQKIIPLLNESNKPSQQILGIYKMFCEGGSPINEHAWKQLHQAYKNKYNSHLFQNEVIGGIYLSSLMQLAKGSYTVEKLQKQKQILKQKEIINQGFIKRIQGTKITNFNCHLSQQQSKQQKMIMSLCQNIKVNNMSKIKQQRAFKEVQNIDRILSQDNKMKYVTYLSQYMSPFQSEYPQLQEYIYQFVYTEPPTIYTHSITINYLKYYKEQILKVRLLENERKGRTMSQKYLQFSLNIEHNLQFWLGRENPFLCSVIEQRAQLEFLFNQDLNKFIHTIRRSLMIWEKGFGMRNYGVSKKYKKIGSMLFKHGFNKQALEYLSKSKDILEDNVDKYLQQYAVLLSEMAQLQLSQKNLSESRILAELSNDKLQKIKQLRRVKKQAYIMKNEQMISIMYNNCRILFRIFQIEKNIPKLKELAHDMNRVLYYQKNPIVFDHVLKMCIVSAIYDIGVQDEGYTKLLAIKSYIATAFQQQKQDKSIKVENHRKKVKQIAAHHIISDIVKQNLCQRGDDKDRQEQVVTLKQFQSVVECGGGLAELEAVISSVLDYVHSKMSV